MRIKILLLTLSLTLLSSFSVLSVSLDQGIYEMNRGEFKAAIAHFDPLVAQGYAPAQYQMALVYQNGYSVPKDGYKALELFKLSADQNYPDAQFELALIYTEGKLVKQDLNKAFQLTHKAAKKELASAQFNLAVMYANGTGVEQDHFKASRWYKRSAKQNYALAQFNLALLYSEGKGVEQSTDLSYVWNTVAAWNGYQKAEDSRLIDSRGMSQGRTEANMEKATRIYKNIQNQLKNKAIMAEMKRID
ncbi:MAG: tetratricopeptide repeat protein [Colwellia sp.]